MKDLLSLFKNRPPTLDLEWSVLPADGTAERRIGPQTPIPSAPANRPDGAFAIGDSIKLVLRPSMSGYLQVWNLGTSSDHVVCLIPDQAGVDECRVEAGKEYSLPGNLLPLPPPNDRIHVSGPTTAASGRHEILVAIVSRRPVRIDSAALGAARPSFATRACFESVEEGAFPLANLPDDEWMYGKLETEVI